MRVDPRDILYQTFREKEIREMALLPTLLWQGIGKLQDEGWIVRDDFIHHLNVAAVLPLKHLDALNRKRLAKIVRDDASAILDAMNPSGIDTALLGSCYLILFLAREGLIPDPTSQAVLVSMAILEEAKSNPDDPSWVTKEHLLAPLAEAGYRTARMLGYF